MTHCQLHSTRQQLHTQPAAWVSNTAVIPLILPVPELRARSFSELIPVLGEMQPCGSAYRSGVPGGGDKS